MAKRGAMDKAARQEAATLGGPAVVTTLLDGGRLAPADVALGAGSRDERVGWFTGVQLKGFEEAIQARCDSRLECLIEAFVALILFVRFVSGEGGGGERRGRPVMCKYARAQGEFCRFA